MNILLFSRICAKTGVEKYKKRAEEAYVFAVEKFTVEKMTADTVSVYRRVCGK
jgi:hypothetical protein